MRAMKPLKEDLTTQAEAMDHAAQTSREDADVCRRRAAQLEDDAAKMTVRARELRTLALLLD